MTAGRWPDVKRIFNDAIERADSDRSAYVAAACGGDDDLRAEVESLLAAHERAGDFIEAGPVNVVAPDMEGRRIGAYKVLREIGHGGMGIVYLAVRADDRYDKQVAIKLIRDSTPSYLERFEQERRILARFEHPNIARLLDGGTTPEGMPYVVMEYVEGVSIDQYCEQRQLLLRDRLTLFSAVCSAVRDAHQHLVVHRDLKPGNILVTAAGVPKLLDFGIARLLAHDTIAGVDLTVTSLRMMTPECASPEQVRGEPITTACDVYALGVLLYRLLAGRSPYRLASGAPHELSRAICEQEPEPPSTTAADTSIRRKLAGDLDTIVLTALQKDRSRRYQSVEQLAGDIQRYLDGFPLLARRDSFGYRARKFVRRHAVAAAAVALVVLAVAAGAMATAWQARVARIERARAERRFNDVRRLAKVFMFDVHDAIENVAGATQGRKLLVTKVLEYLDNLARDERPEPSLQLELAVVYRKVGDVQGNPYRANIDDPAGAMASYRKGLGIMQALVHRDPSTINRRELAEGHSRIADMLWASGKNQDALEHYRLAAGIRDRLAHEHPADEARKIDAADSYYRVGQTLLRLGDHAAAGESYTRSRSIRSEIVAANPGSLDARRNLAVSVIKVGDIDRLRGDYAAAVANHRSAVAILREVLTREPEHTGGKRAIAFALLRLAEDQLETTDLTDASANSKEALLLFEALAKADPLNAQSRGDIGYASRVLADALMRLDRPRQALEYFYRGTSALEQSRRTKPAEADTLRDLAMLFRIRGDLMMLEAAVPAAAAAYRQAVEFFEAPSLRSETSAHLVALYERAGDAEMRLARKDRMTLRKHHAQTACRYYDGGLAAVRRLPQSAAQTDVTRLVLTRLSGKIAACSSGAHAADRSPTVERRGEQARAASR